MEIIFKNRESNRNSEVEKSKNWDEECTMRLNRKYEILEEGTTEVKNRLIGIIKTEE